MNCPSQKTHQLILINETFSFLGLSQNLNAAETSVNMFANRRRSGILPIRPSKSTKFTQKILKIVLTLIT